MPARPHVSTPATILTPILSLLAACPLAHADQEGEPSASEEVARLVDETSPSIDEIEARIPFGDRGHRSFGATLEGAFSSDGTGFGPRASIHYFVADGFEINGSLTVWGHVQDGTDAVSLNPSLGFRYHFVRRETHTLYADLGVGLLLSNEDVPDDGTRFNFTPRAGLGATFPIGDGATRLDVGVRWHHISNASTSGIDDNPDRDGVGVYVGLLFEF
ncbi:MAG: acyloxyacyl hydrolase [Planctomycetota bacterium]